MKESNFITSIPITYMYCETFAYKSEVMKQVDILAQATLMRINDMRYKALLDGHMLTLGQASKGHKMVEFSQPEITPKKDLPRIKMSELKPLELHKHE